MAAKPPKFKGAPSCHALREPRSRCLPLPLASAMNQPAVGGAGVLGFGGRAERRQLEFTLRIQKLEMKLSGFLSPYPLHTL